MKKILSLMLGIAAMFASCSQSEELTAENNSAKEVTFSLTADNGVQTRAATIGTLRYVMAIYDESGQTEVLSATEFSSSTFAVRLDPGKYTCLFWADYGSTNYNATNLKRVVLQDAATEVEAFYAKQGITVTDGGTVNVTLSRAVAKVTLNETDRLVAGTIKVTYDGFKDFNVSEGKGVTSKTLTQIISFANTIVGTVANPTKVGEFLMLANADERVLSDFKVQYKSEAEKTITNVPVQANYVTNINGKFSLNVNQQFSISINDTWATPEKEVNWPPYVTFSAESEQTFKMDFKPYVSDAFTLGTAEYFEYSVGNGSWTRFISTVSDIHFGGTLGDLRLRGKSSKGTAENQWSISKISFGTAGISVDCKGDIRTLIDYENYNTASTANARFSKLFKNNTQLKTAPELPATTLAYYCYADMFSGCTSLIKAPELPAATLSVNCYSWMFAGCSKLSEITMLATDISAETCVDRWLNGAGTDASSRTLTLVNSNIYRQMINNESWLPEIWKEGAIGTSVIYLE